MAQITLTIPDAVAGRVLDGFCAAHGYDPSSGLTKVQFAKQALIDFIKLGVKSTEIGVVRTQKIQDMIAATDQTSTDIDNLNLS